MQPDQVDFARHVRSALTSLYDPATLRRHPLRSALDGDLRQEGTAQIGSGLHRRIVEAIESLKPAPEAHHDSRGSRRYRILQLRYVEAKDAGEVQTQLAMSKSQYYREHELAVQSLAELLWTQRTDRSAATPPASADKRAGLLTEPRDNLPIQMTSFIGREQELAQVQQLLQQSRLLTLTGVGGVGKTRIALRTAEVVLGNFPDGVWFIELASLVDGAFVGTAIAEALGVRELPSESVLSALARALRDRELLLILDNCEHLLDSCVDVVHKLLSSCPRIRILATSRELLGVGAETLWRVPPLSLPDRPAHGSLEAIKDSGAVSLFVERARAALPAFELAERNAPVVVDICRKLDGLPLALELAASRVEFLSLDELSARVTESPRVLTSRDRTAPIRQQTLRATIEWSYGLLSDDEQRFFDRLSVFAGGWTLEGAEVVTGGGAVDADSVVDLLGHLVDKSLVVAESIGQEHARYHMLESLRQFGNERLVARGEQEVIRLRHLEFLTSLLERADIEMTSAPAVWLRRVETEHYNLRSVLRWLIARKDSVGAQRLAGAARRFWVYGGYATEGRRWLTEALDLDSASRPLEPGSAMFLSDAVRQRLAVRARALGGLGGTAYIQGDLDTDWRANSESLELWRKLGSAGGVARSLLRLGMVATDRGQFELARTLLEEGITYRHAPGDQADPVLNLALLAELACQEGKYSEAVERGEEALALAKSRGSAVGIIGSLRTLGEVHRQHGEHDLAQMRWEEGVATMRLAGGKLFTDICLTRLGRLAIEQGDTRRAYDLLTESLRLASELADRLGMARCLEGFAELAAALDLSAEALQLAGAAAVLREIVGASVLPTERASFDRALVSARQNLGESAAARAWTEGRTDQLDETIRTALHLGEII